MRLHLCKIVISILLLLEENGKLGARLLVRLEQANMATLAEARVLPATKEQVKILQDERLHESKLKRSSSSNHFTSQSSYKSQSKQQSSSSDPERLFKRSLSEEKLNKKTREFLFADAADISAHDLERGTGCSHKSRRLIGYVTSWSGRPLTLKLASRYTNLIYAFARLNADGSVALPDDQQRLLELLAARDGLASRGHNLSISLAVGGWTYSEHFSSVLADTAKRGAFIRNISALLSTKNGFDGIDIDWDYQTTSGLLSNRVEDSANYVSFVRELRARLPTGKLISISGADIVLRGFDIAKLIGSLDWFCVTTYDFTSALDTKTVAPNAPLRIAAPPGHSGKLNAYRAIKQYLSRSGQPSRIASGLPFLGRFWDSTTSSSERDKVAHVRRIRRAAHDDDIIHMVMVIPILFAIVLMIACCYKVLFLVGFERNRESKAGGKEDRLAALVIADTKANRPKQILELIIKPVEEVPCNDYICKPRDLGYNNLPPVDDELVSILVDQKIIIDRNLLTLGNLIGSGQFGRVYKGFLKGDNGERKPVAVKMPQKKSDWSDTTDNRAFLEEGLMMKDFDHENVLALIGVAFDASGLPMVITPFMLHGDLKSFILGGSTKLTLKELIEFGVQIARGMAHLSNKKFVHRDLAARNCMLDEKRVVKVADFGLSRDIYGSDYYASNDKASKLPVKWMAIESLQEAIYTTKSDVWSYGVVLWELTTGCIVPYPDVDDYDILDFLEKGRRMLRPRRCPVSLYEIMQSCWRVAPAERPSFDELVVRVSNVIAEYDAMKNDDIKTEK